MGYVNRQDKNIIIEMMMEMGCVSGMERRMSCLIPARTQNREQEVLGEV